MTKPIEFTEEYYKEVIVRNGYNPFDFGLFDFDIGSQKYNELNRRYLCHQNGDVFIKTAKEKRIITTGFGMSGLPHLGTISHIRRILKFQEDGERCQIVLGDLDAYNGRSKELDYTVALAEKYRNFIIKMGIDPEKTIIRSQNHDAETLRNMYLLARYTKDDDFNSAEEDNHDYYVTKGIVDSTMTLRRKLSLLLMASDFITLGQKNDSVMVMLGVDEHQYVLFADALREKVDEASGLTKNFSISTMYSRITPGFNGHTRMSKSIKGSGITIESSPQEVIDTIMGESLEGGVESTTTYHLMNNFYYYPYEKFEELLGEWNSNEDLWNVEKREFCNFLINILKLWDTRKIPLS